MQEMKKEPELHIDQSVVSIVAESMNLNLAQLYTLQHVYINDGLFVESQKQGNFPKP